MLSCSSCCTICTLLNSFSPGLKRLNEPGAIVGAIAKNLADDSFVLTARVRFLDKGAAGQIGVRRQRVIERRGPERVSRPIKSSGKSTRGRLIPAVSIETISFARDMRPRQKSSASSSETGRRMTRICGICVR